MINLEPSWEELGDIVAEHICQSTIPTQVKAELVKIVSNMATIAHHARLFQLWQQYRDGEIDSLPGWAQSDEDKPLAGVNVYTSQTNSPFSLWLKNRGANVERRH